MTPSAQHTPTPWMSRNNDRFVITGSPLGPIDALDPFDAAFIVRAVNAHDALVAALREIVDAKIDLLDSERRIRVYAALDRVGAL